MMKRVMSFILSVVMVVSMLPAQVLAEEFTELSEPQETIASTEPEATSAPTQPQTTEPEPTTAPTEPEATSAAPTEPEATSAPTEYAPEDLGTITDEAANEATASGSCGTNATWSLEGGTLTISGTGAISEAGGWHAHANLIHELVVEEGVTSICKEAFPALPNLEIVELPSTITDIGRSAFEECTGLVLVNIPERVESIGANAFASTPELLEISIPASVKDIGGSAFANSGIRTLELQEGLLSIGSEAFANCTNLTEVTIPESVTTIVAPTVASSPFYGCNANLVITCGNYEAPEGWGPYWNYYANGKTLTTTFRKATPEDLFWASVDPSMETLTIPGYITEIPAGAFENYTALKKVTMEEGVTTIGAKAFGGCTALELVYIPASVTTIAGEFMSGAFYGSNEDLVIYCASETEPAGWGEFWSAVYGEIPCEVCMGGIFISEHYWANLDTTATHIEIPKGVVYIPEDYFKDSSIESIVIPDSVTTVGDNAFYNCVNLASVDFGNGVESIGQAAFSYCASLKEVVLPKSLTQLSSEVFFDCYGLERVELPDTLTEIGSKAFASCTGLKSIYIPASVTTIYGSNPSYSPFYDCSSSLQIYCEAPSQPSGWGNYWYYVGSSIVAVCTYGATRKDADFWSTVDKSAEIITIPEGVTVIPNAAFQYRSTLKQIYLPDTLKTIGKNAFQSCTGLTSIYIPASVETFTSSTSSSAAPFLNCSSNLKIYCEATEKPSGWGTYWNLHSYGSTTTSYKHLTTTYGYARMDYEYWLNLDKTQETIVIPEGITAIPDYAFDGNTTLKEIHIPSTVKSIGGYAFRKCTALVKVKLSEGLMSIGGYAFNGCTALESMPIPEGVTSIGMYAFSACTALKDVTIPSTVTGIASEAFYNCGAMEIVYISDLAAWCNISFNTSTTNPLASGSQLYVQGQPLTELTIPASVTKLNAYAFYGCEGLNKVTVPDTVTTIGGYVFLGCKDLEEVYFKATTENVGLSVFQGCTGLRKVEIGDGVATLHSSMFSGCSGLTSVKLPDTLVAIESSALSGCSALSSITLPDGLETIGNTAFSNCTALQSVKIPASVTTISAAGKSTGPFYGCTNLTIFTSLEAAPSGWGTYWNNIGDSTKATVHYNTVGNESEFWGSIDKTAETIEIPEGITRIPANIFKNNTTLKRVTIPSTVTAIEDNAFYGCTALEEVALPDTVTTLGEYAFYGCTALTEVTLPNTIDTISAWCFYGCTGLKQLVLPESVTTIGAKAFGGCTALEGVYIPAGVTTISGSSYSDSIFYNCKSILKVFCAAAGQPEGWNSSWNHISSSSSKATTYFGMLPSDAKYWTTLDRTQEELIIPNTVTAIPANILQNVSTLKKVVVGSGVKSIGEYAFYGCTGLTFIYVPSTVETLGDYCFRALNSTAYTDADSDLTGWSATWHSSNLSDELPTVYGVILQEAEYWATLDKTQSVISLPSYITKVPDSAFSGCTNLTTINLPDGLKTIGSKAFYNCTGLLSLYVPDSVTSVASNAFQNSGLESITFGGSMEQWMQAYPSNNVKVNCADDIIYKSGTCGENAKYILTEDGVLMITGTGAMTAYGNSSSIPWYSNRDLIKEIRVGEGITVVNGFTSCNNLTAVSLPSTLTAIGESAFSSCSGLTGIDIPKGVTTIGAGAFSYCSGLTSITIPSTVAELGSSTFSYCSALQTVTFAGTAIKELPGSLFYYCSKLQNITLPNGLETIGGYVFYYCGMLTEITVPEGVTHMGSWVFQNCQEIISIHLPASLQFAGSYCFEGNTADLYFAGTMDQWAHINESVRKAICSDGTIRTWGYYGDNHFYTLTIDGDLKLTGSGAVPDISDKGTIPWSGWQSSIVSVTLPEDIPNIGRRMFENCSKLESIHIPATVTTIGEKAFTNCSKANIVYNGSMDQWMSMHPDNYIMTSVSCSDGTILSSGSCGENLRFLLTGDGTFTVTGEGTMTDYTGYSNVPWYKHREKIYTVSIGSGVTSVGDYSFYNCDNLTEITLADSVTAIGKYAFYDCDGLYYRVNLGNGLETIGESAFNSCDTLSEIAIPMSVNAIGNSAFGNCTNLRRVDIQDLASWCGITFGNAYANPLCNNDYSELRIDSWVQEYVVIPEGTTAIGAYAFYNYDLLREITIPASVTDIGVMAFEGCDNLEKITYGGTVDSWMSMYRPNNRKVICSDDTILYSNNASEVTCLVLESGLLEIGGIGPIATKQWSNYNDLITNVVIAPGITEIGSYTFAYLHNLTSVSIPDTVVSISNHAFSECYALESITIPASVQTIGNYAFRACDALQLIQFEHVFGDPLSLGTQVFYFTRNSTCVTTVGVPYARVINESIKNYDWTSCKRRPKYVSTRVLPAEAIEIESLDNITVLEAGLDIGLDVIFTPAEATSEVLWTILEDRSTGTATINEYGWLTGLTPGIVVVQAQAHDSGVTAEIAITFTTPTAEAEAVEVYVADYHMNEAEVGTTVQMAAEVLPGNTADKRVRWWVENGTGSATIDENGCLTAESTGTVTVYAETVNGIKGSCVVEIMRYVEDFDFTFNGQSAPGPIAVGERIQIAAIPTPADATIPHPNWEITNLGTCTSIQYRTHNGELEVTGLTPGTIVISVRSNDSRGYETSFELTVADNLAGEYTLPSGSKLQYNTASGMITGASGAAGDVTIPERIGDTVITGIAPYAFVTRSGDSATGNSDLTSLVIPATVKTIGNFAFYNCDNLASVHFEGDSQLKTIGKYAFGHCDGLATVTYTGSQLERIEDHAFYHCDVLTGMTFPAGIQHIGMSAFEYCRSFSSLTIPENLTDIGQWAFSGLEGLEKLTMSGELDATGILDWRTVDKLTLTGTTVIGGYWHEDGGWSGVPGREARTLILTDTITHIQEKAFEGCHEMTSVTFSSNLKYIGNDAFSNCRRLTSVELPEGLESLGEGAFAWCEELSEINIPQSLKSVGRHCFEGSRNLQLFDLSGVPDVLQTELNLSEVVHKPEWLVRCASENMMVYPYLETVEGQPEAYQIADWYGNQDGEWIVPRGTGIVRLYYRDDYTGASAFKDIYVEAGLQIFSDYTNQVASGQSLQLQLIRPNGESVSATWSVRDQDLNYASIDSNGLLKTKTVSNVREIVVTAVPRDGGAVISKTFYIMPKATKVMLLNDDGLVGESGTSVQTLNVDMSALPQMLLRASCEPEDAFGGVKWTSSAPGIVEVDEGGLLSFLKPGTATIKATAIGTSVSASVKFNVVFVETTKTFTATVEVPTIGLQPGQSVPMQIFGADKTTPLDPALFDYTASGTASILLDEEAPGWITAGETAGTATITATLRDDPLKRKATVKVKVIPLQVQSLQLDPAPHPLGELIQLTEAGDRWMMILDAERLYQGVSFQVGVFGFSHEGQLMFPTVKWATSDKSIAQISTNAEGDTFVNVPPDVSGTCVIQAKSTDLLGATAELIIEVRDYAPKLGNNVLTVNSYSGGSATTQLIEVYDNVITEASLWEYMPDQDMWKKPQGLKVEAANGQLKITAEEVLSAGNYDLMLDVYCANGRNYNYDITVKVENKLPTLTVKQKTKFNLFYTESAAEFTITAKDAEVVDVRLADTDDFEMVMEDGKVMLYYSEDFLADPSATVDKTAVVDVFLDGYGVSVQKKLSIATVTTKPKLTMSPVSSIINTSSDFGQDLSTLVQVHDDTNKLWLDMETALQAVNAGTFAEAVATAEGLLLTLTGTAGGTASITVQAENWTQPMTLKHKITVQTKAPALKLAASTLKLNRILADNAASTKVTLTQSNLQLHDVQILSTAAEGTAIWEEAQKLDVYYDGDGNICASIIDPEDAPKAATYNFYCTGILANGQELPKVTLKVGVGTTVPKVKLKTTTLNLNTQLTGLEVASSAVTITGAEGYELAGFTQMDDLGIDGLSLRVEDGVVNAELYDEAITCKRYALKLNPVIRHIETGREFELSTKLSLTVNVYNSAKFAVTLSTKGKLDTLDPESAITYTITKMSNISGELEGVSVVGTDGALFDAEVVEGSDKPQVKLTLKPGQDYATNKTYKVQLELTICGQDVQTKVLSFRVTQSKLKVTVPKTVTIFQYQSVPMEVALQVAEPAEIWYVNLGSKTTAGLKEAVGELTLTEDNRVLLPLVDSSKLVKGKSYTLYLEVTPVNNAENAAPTQVKVNVKISK